MKTHAINEIEAEIVGRASTGCEEIDWLMGYSTDATGTSWGLPQGKLTMVAGQSGVGKSRWSIAMACSLANIGIRVLYIQNEVTLGTFAGWVKGRIQSPQNLRVANGRDLSDLTETIKKETPQVVFLDSINQMNEFGSGSKTNITAILEGDNGTEGLNDLCRRIGVHLFFISHLNQDGSVKGSTTLIHLIDIVLKVVPAGIDGHFVVKLGDKHRCGRVGQMFRTLWKHTETGVTCESNHRLEDPKWCETHNIRKQVLIPRITPKVTPKKKPWRLFGKHE